jgi:hypothetical protein
MANDDRYAIVPSDLKLCALDLSAIGANELAWHRQDCLDVLKVLHDHGQAVLGGDVYEIKDQNRFLLTTIGLRASGDWGSPGQITSDTPAI